MIPYFPEKLTKPERMIDVFTAWDAVAPGIEDIVNRFCKKRDFALEFGVEKGFSTVVLSNFFKHVIGVDHFLGDQHSSHEGCWYEETRERLKPYKNIELHPWSWQDWIKLEWMNDPKTKMDLIHIDAEHTYAQTHPLLSWAVKHSPCVIAHDTQSFPDVMRACSDVAAQEKLQFYNWDDGKWGLGILVPTLSR